MSPSWELATYSLLLGAAAVAGGALPLLTARRRGVSALAALSAGVMLGTVVFVLLPEAVHQLGLRALALVPVGFFGIWGIEALLHRRVGDPSESQAGVGVAGGLGLGVSGAGALLGFSAHTVVDGLSLAAAVEGGVGMSVFLAILAHKLPTSVSLSALLLAEARPTRTVLLALGSYGLMVPLGALLYLGISATVPVERLAAWAMALSAGTFLFISVVELLPGVLRPGTPRRSLNALVLLGGVALMAVVGRLTHGMHG